MVDISKNILLLNISQQFDAPVSQVSLFKVKNKPVHLKSSVIGEYKHIKCLINVTINQKDYSVCNLID